MFSLQNITVGFQIGLGETHMINMCKILGLICSTTKKKFLKHPPYLIKTWSISSCFLKTLNTVHNSGLCTLQKAVVDFSCLILYFFVILSHLKYQQIYLSLSGRFGWSSTPCPEMKQHFS